MEERGKVDNPVGQFEEAIRHPDRGPPYSKDIGAFSVNTVIDKFFTTPMSWLLAVPVVLLDHILAPDLPELRRYAAPPKSLPHGPPVHS